MAVLRASDAPVGLGRGKPNRAATSTQPTQWVRPADWVTFTAPTASEQKVIGTVAVFNQESNYLALATTTSAGTYTVDWGDGTSTTHTSNTTAEKNYSWSSVSSDTLSSRGYRQAVVTVTPTTGGATFSAVRLDRRHSAISSGSPVASNPWLDIAVAAPNATSVAFSYDTGSTRTATMLLCEQINIVAHNTTNNINLFRGMQSLQSVPLFNTASVGNMGNMFLDCYLLQTVPLFNTALVTTMSSMFQGCYSLKSVPLFNTVSVNTMSNMFNGCSLLQSVPLFNTALVTSMSAMFTSCSSLESVPLFNTALVTNMNNTFQACSSLKSVPLFNTVSVTGTSNMFVNCVSLQSVPLFNTASVSSMSGMFNGCSSLQAVPLFNTAAVISMQSFLQNCFSLQSVPLFNTASVTNMQSMLQNCYSLQSVPLFNTASVLTTQNMFSGCFSLQSVPLFNTAAATNVQNMFSTCFSLKSVPELTLSAVSSPTNNGLGLGSVTFTSAAASLGQAKLTGNRWTQTFQYCGLGAAQLNEMYTALAVLNPNVTNVTATGTTVTYTVDDRRAFVTGRTVTMTGISPAGYNLTNATVATVTAGAGNTGTFTVTNAATGAFVSGGIATIQDNKTITVASNPGVATDDPTIATNKGWTVTG